MFDHHTHTHTADTSLQPFSVLFPTRSCDIKTILRATKSDLNSEIHGHTIKSRLSIHNSNTFHIVVDEEEMKISEKGRKSKLSNYHR